MKATIPAQKRLAEIVNVSRETFENLVAYANLIEKWNPKINLIAKSTVTDIWERHIVDSAQVWPNRPKKAKSWVDIGTGGGMPGLVMAIIAKEHAPNIEFHFVESDARKCAFLRNAVRELDLDVRIHNERIEKLDLARVDVVSARALASLDKLLELSQELLEPSGNCLFLKGESYAKEITEARRNWRFEETTISSVTSSNAALLKIKEIRRVD